MNMELDIRIMAVKSRKKNVRTLLKALNLDDAAVTWDDRKEGGDALYTARKAWLSPWPKGCTHRIVLADDAKVCKNFRAIALQLAKRCPDDIFTLFHPSEFVPGGPIARVCSKMAFGVGIMLPRALIRPIFEFPIRKEDDMSVTFYCYQHELQILTPMPSIVQHLDEGSLLGSASGIVSKSFVDEPVMDWKLTEIINIP